MCSSHNSSNYDFPTIKKAPAHASINVARPASLEASNPHASNGPNLDDEFDSIMSQLNTLDGQLESHPEPPTHFVQPVIPVTPQPVVQTAKRVSFKSGNESGHPPPPLPSKPKPVRNLSGSSYGSSSNSTGPVRLPGFGPENGLPNQMTPTKPTPPVRPRPSIPQNIPDGQPTVLRAESINRNISGNGFILSGSIFFVINEKIGKFTQ